MGTSRRALRWLLLMAVVIAAFFGGLWLYRGFTAGEKPAAELPTAEVSQGNLLITVSASGNVTLPSQARLTLTFPVSGTVKEVGVEMGDEVKQGEALVRLEDEDYRLAVLKAEVAVNSAQIALQEAEAAAKTAGEALALAKHDLTAARTSAQKSLADARDAVKQGLNSYQETVRHYYGISLSEADSLKAPGEVLTTPPVAAPQEWVEAVNSVANAQAALVATTRSAALSLATAQDALSDAEEAYHDLVLSEYDIDLSPEQLYDPPPLPGVVTKKVAKAHRDMLLAKEKLESTRLQQAELVAQSQSNQEQARLRLAAVEHPSATVAAAQDALNEAEENYRDLVWADIGVVLSDEALFDPPPEMVPGFVPERVERAYQAMLRAKEKLDSVRAQQAEAQAAAESALEQARLHLSTVEQAAAVAISTAEKAVEDAEDSYRNLVQSEYSVDLSAEQLYLPPPVPAVVPRSIDRAYRAMLRGKEKLEEAIARNALNVDKAQRTLEQAELAQQFLAARAEPAAAERWGVAGGLAWKQISDAYDLLAEARRRLELAQAQAAKSIAAAEAGVAKAERAARQAGAPLSEVTEAPNQIELRRLQLSQARAALKQAQRDLAGTVLLAPFDGVVAEVKLEVGDKVAAGATAAVLVDPSELEVETTVDEIDIAQVAIGQWAAISLDALPGTRLPGRVKVISPLAQIQAGVVTYKVVLEVVALETGQRQGSSRPTGSEPSTPRQAAEPTVLRQGMTALAEIVVESKRGVLLVPARAVRSLRGRQTVQVMSADGTVNEQEVVTGSSNGRFTEIVTGLEAGQRVVLPAGTTAPTPRPFGPGFPGGGGFGGGRRFR